MITATALVLRNVELHPLLKFGLAALIAVPLCFVLGNLIRKSPYADRVCTDRAPDAVLYPIFGALGRVSTEAIAKEPRA